MHDRSRRRWMAMMAAAAWLRAGRAALAGGGDAPATGADLFDRVWPLLAALHDPVLSSFLADWPGGMRGPESAPLRSPPPTGVPVLRWLPRVSALAPPWSSAWVADLAAAAPALAWRRSYSAAAAGERFYANYGWTELAGLSGPVPSVRLACGVLLLGPHVTYPAHHHEAEELYVPLAGAARWRAGTQPWRERRPGVVIHHARHQPHAMQTRAEPLLALYLWRSADLAQSSQLEVS